MFSPPYKQVLELLVKQLVSLSIMSTSLFPMFVATSVYGPLTDTYPSVSSIFAYELNEYPPYTWKFTIEGVEISVWSITTLIFFE